MQREDTSKMATKKSAAVKIVALSTGRAESFWPETGSVVFLALIFLVNFGKQM